MKHVPFSSLVAKRDRAAGPRRRLPGAGVAAHRQPRLGADANTPGLNPLLDLAARVPAACRLMERCVALGTALARLVGSRFGGLGYEVEDAGGRTARLAVVAAGNSFVTAVAPAVLAARRILDGGFEERGLVEPLRHTVSGELVEYLRPRGIEVLRL